MDWLQGLVHRAGGLVFCGISLLQRCPLTRALRCTLGKEGYGYSPPIAQLLLAAKAALRAARLSSNQAPLLCV